MSTENTANAEQNSVVDPFAIFNTKVEDIKSFEEPVTKEKTDYDKIYYEPDPKKAANGTYQSIVKPLPNIYDPRNPVVRKTTYKLPNPNNPKWTLYYDSPSTVGEECMVVKRFFWARDSADARIKAIGKELKRNRKAAMLVQIIKDPQRPDLEGQVRIMRFPDGMEIDVLVKAKIAPTQADIEMGKKAENVFDPFHSRYLLLKVTAGTNGRDFSQTAWTDADQKGGMKLDGAMLKDADRTNPAVQTKIVELLKQPEYNLVEHCGYKAPDQKMLDNVAKSLRIMFGEEAPPQGTPPPGAANTETKAPETVNTASQPASPAASQPVQNAAVNTAVQQPAATEATPVITTEKPAEITTPAGATPASDADFFKSLGIN